MPPAPAAKREGGLAWALTRHLAALENTWGLVEFGAAVISSHPLPPALINERSCRCPRTWERGHRGANSDKQGEQISLSPCAFIFGDLLFLLPPGTRSSTQSPVALPVHCFEKQYPHCWRNTGCGARLRTRKRLCVPISVCTAIVLNVIYLRRRSDRQNERPNSIPPPPPLSG